MLVSDESEDQYRRKQSIQATIKEIYRFQKIHPEFDDTTLNNHLKRIAAFNMGYHDYFDFFDYINHANYMVGNSSEMLFSEDRKGYFLGTLMTHYLPEFFISLGLSHNILEEFVQNGHVDDIKKNIFLEHNKLVYLSSEELYNIINLLNQYDDTKELSITIYKINDRLDQLTKISEDLIISHHANNNPDLYLNTIHELLELAEKLSKENTTLLESLLKSEERYLNDKIIFYRLLLIFMMVLVSAIFVYFFHIFNANVKKDKELKELNDSLLRRVEEEVNKNRQKDQQFLQQSRLAQMGEMISMIAHQWRQPLAAISSTSISLELKATSDKADKETTVRLSQNISKYAQHLSTTIDDFINFFKSVKEEKETSYSEVINAVLGIVQISIENKNISFVKELNTEEKFKTYPNELKQVILNLIKNAEDVLLENKIEMPYIKISTYSEDDKHILEVSDNGGGVPEDIIEKIFDPYFSTKLDKNGTGLGLYMSKTIIEEHCGGELTVYNDEFGAVFKVMLSSKKSL
jgi:signal transduction histidine kinase